MKNKIIFILLGISLMGVKTEDEASVFKTKNIVWYGLDFTKATFVGDSNLVGTTGEYTGPELVNKYIPAWNNLVVTEAKKFDLMKAFDKEGVYYNIQYLHQQNEKIDPKNCIAKYPGTILPEDIDEMIRQYSGDKKEGLGLTFIIESFNKRDVEASLFVVFFDISGKKVLFLDHVKSKPVGMGPRNYWAGAIYNTLKQMGDGRFRNQENSSR